MLVLGASVGAKGRCYVLGISVNISIAGIRVRVMVMVIVMTRLPI